MFRSSAKNFQLKPMIGVHFGLNIIGYTLHESSQPLSWKLLSRAAKKSSPPEMRPFTKSSEQSESQV